MKVPESCRIRIGRFKSSEADGNNGFFTFGKLQIIASDGEGWEHVSVSRNDRCPTWEEMCEVKDLFWKEEDCVIQFHPPKNEYINNHPYCLHLWKPIDEIIKTPPSILTGFKSK